MPVGAGARAGAKTVYALAYRGVDDAAALDLLRADIAAIKARGLGFVLPSELDACGGDAALLVLERSYEIEGLLALLKSTDAKAVFTMDGAQGGSKLALLKKAANEGVLELAAPIGSFDSPALLAGELGTARLDFFTSFGRDVSCFVYSSDEERDALFHTGANKSCGSGLSVILYGNGRNELLPSGAAGGLRLIHRAVRLPDWTIEQFFTEIAAES